VAVTTVDVPNVASQGSPEPSRPPAGAPLIIAANVDQVLIRFIEQPNGVQMFSPEEPEMSLNLAIHIIVP
jgi:hypothetical protein